VLKDFPSSNTVLNTEKGRAFCIKIDVFKKKMWFAYVENSMAWYDLDIAEVKKLIAINKKGEKAPALEDLKVVENPLVTSDLIQENSVDRFEKKNRKQRPNNNRDRSPKNQDNKNPNQRENRNRNAEQKTPENRNRNTEQKSQDNRKPAPKNKPESQPQSQGQPQENKNYKKPFKKPKKKTPPKDEGNA
jgi:hypothetical protein